MSNVTECQFDQIPEEIQAQMIEQAQEANIYEQEQDEENRTLSIDDKILISISENINTMAAAINSSEEQKRNTRDEYVRFFKYLLVVLILFAMALILIDTLGCAHVRIEFLVSVIVAIVADVFAIVQTLVKYMTNVEDYDAYNKLIESLLKHIRQ